MKKLKLILFILPLLFFSCNKDTILTQGQLTAIRLEKDLGLSPDVATNFNSIWVSNLSTGATISSGGTTIMITSDGFAIISGLNFITLTFNLEQLKSYQIVPTGNLDLYF
jgi:hypothetical protein